MKVSIEKGNLIVVIPLQKAAPSASGKTLVCASTHGNQKTGVMIEGKELTLGLNAYVKA